MDERSCGQCGQTFAIRSLFDLNGMTYCEPCAQQAAARAKTQGQPSSYVPLVSKLLCGRCNTFIGFATDAVPIGSLRFCASCAPLIKDFDYPPWLKLSVAGLLLLLVVSLADGRKYFHAGREMYVGERLVSERQFAQAVPHLEETLRIAPNSDKAALLTAKAALLSGEFDVASKALNGHDQGRFEDAEKPEFREVQALWDRATAALGKASQAQKLEAQDGQELQAARLMHEAAAGYPEMPQLAFAAQAYDEGVAFVQKDYDAFLKISETQWNQQPSGQTAAMLSSALACKFAITGDDSYRMRSEDMLEKARQLAKGDKESLKNLDEFAERNRYRLTSRKIITKTEYDRKFRGGQAPPQ